MSGKAAPLELDGAIHERARLAIVSALVAADEPLTFRQLRDLLSMTDGNLSVHARILADVGYVSIDKQFVDGKPRTSFAMTASGRAAFERYVARMRAIIDAAGIESRGARASRGGDAASRGPVSGRKTP
ncbi:MAG: transcriptional regulator [Planctomycetes bacterium]|nr:transcriptional regulator [Planctomycetota bacterium]